ncbi:MAG TPA: RDD family protein, partial [Chitinophagaceae bacterium]
LNFGVDTGLIFLLAYAASKTWDFYVINWGYPYYSFATIFFSVMFVYYTLFEALTCRTPGKWLSISKVIRENGKKPGLLQVLIRSAVRLTIIDIFFLPFLDRTLHDYLSRTDVVEA